RQFRRRSHGCVRRFSKRIRLSAFSHFPMGHASRALGLRDLGCLYSSCFSPHLFWQPSEVWACHNLHPLQLSRSDRLAGCGLASFGIFPADRRQPTDAHLSQLLQRDPMISAPYLEIAVLVLGTVILLIESFSSKLDRRYLGYTALVGLALIFLGTFLVAPQSATSSAPFWNFYSADATSLFFQRIALATTAAVIVMMLDFAPLVSSGDQRATPQSRLGVFFALPLFTCAGLMWMSSAIDFVLIFVSLELVTISFYVLLGFARRNPASLEAAVKYLVLSAVATGFLVYGITWIFGATGETNLQKITTVLSRPGLEQNAALFGGVLVIIALGFKIAAVPFHIW